MPSRTAKYSRVDTFAGLSDRQVPVSQTRIESPDLRNVDFHEGTLKRRLGHQRMHNNILRDCSIRLDGANPISNQSGQYVRIANSSAGYRPGNKLFLMIDVVMRDVKDVGATPDESFILSRGHGTGANRYLSISYEPDTPGWTVRAYDLANTTARSWSVTDGSAPTDIINQYRRLEIECTTIGSNVYTFRVLKADGTVVGTDTETVATWQTAGNLGSATGWVLGADQSSAGAAVADTYAHVTLANFAVWDSATQPTYFAGTAASRVARELDNSPTATDEFTGLDGYWILNDGTGNTLTDSSPTANHGVIGGAGPEWVSDPALGAGPSALEFFGEEGAVVWRCADAMERCFGVANYAARRWAVTFLFVPRMGQGESAVRDQTVFWSGTSNTTPAPIGVVVDSTTYTADRLTVIYKDGTSNKAVTIAKDLSDLVNRRLRVWISHADLAGGDQLDASFVDLDSGTGLPLTFTSYAGTAAATAGTNGGFSDTITIGRLMTSVVLPYAYDGFNTQPAFAGRCVVSDFAFIRASTAAAGMGPGIGGTALGGIGGFNFQYAAAPPTWSMLIGNPPGVGGSQIHGVELVAGLPLDDGQGLRPRVTGVLADSSSHSAYLVTSSDDGARWDIGITDPFDPPEIDGIFDYRRTTNDGKFQSSLLVVTGSTLYEITDLKDGVGSAKALPVAAGLNKGGKCTFSQLANTVYIGRPNGKRPMKWNGTYLDWVGIEAPIGAPVGASSATSGSLTAAAKYWVYVTYRNMETGVESNPSFGVEITIAGGQSSIGTLQIPVSPDPQVNQRRIWISGANAAENAGPIYLAENASEETTVDDNSAITYTGGITVVDTTNATITDFDENSPPPSGSLVRSFKDRLWVSGNPLAPTRIHYSGVLTPDTYDGTAYLELDQDTGDRITGLGRLLNRLVVFMRDGRIQISSTGNSEVPFSAAVSSRDSGSVGAQGHTEYEGILPHIGERDIFLWDGGQALNISSPSAADRPSIQDTMRNKIETSRLTATSMSVYRSKNQIWTALTSTGNSRNDMVLIFDFEMGTWSRYDVDVDCLAEVEDADDESFLYAGIRGHLCRMDLGDYDGPTALIAGTATSGDTESLTDSAASFTANQNKGMYVVWYDVSANTVRSARVRSNTTTAFKFYDAVTAPASGDPYVVGGIAWYADFVADFGSPMRMKRLSWFRAAVDSSLSSARVRLTVVADHPERDSASAPWNASGNSPQEFTSLIATTEKYWLASVGGLGRSFRLRISDSGYATPTSEQAVPSGPRLDVFQFELEAEELDVQ